MTYLRYIKYLFWHKVFVLIEACHLGIPWLGLIHDWSKFRSSEFIAYAKRFEKKLYYKAYDRNNPNFNYAWLLHQGRCKHHWEFWCLIMHSGNLKPLEMPEQYRKEMIADWAGAGRAKGRPDTKAWYMKHRNKMLLAPKTRELVDNYFEGQS